MVVVAETNTSVMENNDTQKVPMRIHQATTTDDQANHVKDNYVLTITKVSIKQRCQHRRGHIAYLDN
jgi:tRNA U55 pseudouridine synthase TruB